MPFSPENETIPIPRNRVLVVDASSFVVHWEENRVQDLVTGRYADFDDCEILNIITDFELLQLKRVGIVLHYDDELVHLNPSLGIVASITPRAYYLNTVLPKNYKRDVEQVLVNAGLADEFSVRAQERFVIIRRAHGMSFATFDTAEKARELLVQQLPDLLGQTVVAFVETLPNG